MRIIFAGTPAFALPTLQALHAGDHDVVAVFTQPDRPAGRGRKLAAGPIKQYALEQRIPLHQPSTLHHEALRLMELKPDVMVVAAYGLLLPTAVLAIPTHGCVNVHASLLPRWRGAAPIARAIEAGDDETGITIMQMEAGLDTGPMLLQRRATISDTDTTASLEARLARVGAEALVAALAKLELGRLVAQPQDPAAACYAPKLQKREGVIDWSLPALTLHRKIRAYNPRPIATTTWHGETLRLWDVGPLATTDKFTEPPGTVVAMDTIGVHVQTGGGILCITRLQAAGGRALTAREFLNGTPLRAGERLGT
ncbi:MAG TPA: methionyl-tRNA formyltransferase [Burkholderiales bacterium]